MQQPGSLNNVSPWEENLDRFGTDVYTNVHSKPSNLYLSHF